MNLNIMQIFYMKLCLLIIITKPQSIIPLDDPQLYYYYQTTKFTLAKLEPHNGGADKHTLMSTNEENKSTSLNEVHFDSDDDKSSLFARPTTMQSGRKEQLSGSTNRKRLEEGSFCRRSFDGRSGYCVVAYQCLHVIKEYREHGANIDVCTYRKNIPVICCSLAEKHIDDQRISARKCQEYHSALKDVKIGEARTFSEKICVSSVPMIVNGETTGTDEFPHMAALGWTQNDADIKFGCGGTLVSEHFVLTAAHCATSGGKPPDMVRLGSQNLNHTTKEQQDINILIIILHPKYKSSSYYHDIALLKLMKRVQFSKQVRPACLWQLPEMKIHSVVAAGWGRTEFLGPRSDELRKVDLDVIDQKVCKTLYNKERRLPRGIIDEQLCAGHLEGGRDTCQGDSGGPLHVELPEYNCVKFVVGVTSFGKFCAAPNAPGVYTKVYAYLDWIEKIVFRK